MVEKIKTIAFFFAIDDFVCKILTKHADKVKRTVPVG